MWNKSTPEGVGWRAGHRESKALNRKGAGELVCERTPVVNKCTTWRSVGWICRCEKCWLHAKSWWLMIIFDSWSTDVPSAHFYLLLESRGPIEIEWKIAERWLQLYDVLQAPHEWKSRTELRASTCTISLIDWCLRCICRLTNRCSQNIQS